MANIIFVLVLLILRYNSTFTQCNDCQYIFNCPQNNGVITHDLKTISLKYFQEMLQGQMKYQSSDTKARSQPSLFRLCACDKPVFRESM